jgi:hypothetical protein
VGPGLVASVHASKMVHYNCAMTISSLNKGLLILLFLRVSAAGVVYWHCAASANDPQDWLDAANWRRDASDGSTGAPTPEDDVVLSKCTRNDHGQLITVMITVNLPALRSGRFGLTIRSLRVAEGAQYTLQRVSLLHFTFYLMR